MSEGRQTVAGAYQKIAAHEDLCAERYANIHAKLDEVKGDQKAARNAMFGLAVAIVGWLVVQIYSDLKAPKAAPAAVVAVNPPPAPQSTPIAPR